jgi:hypothetical protein
VLPVVLLGLGGFLIGGVYALWRTARLMAMVLALAALLAVGGGVAWLLSG